MGKNTNGKKANILGSLTLIVMTVAAVVLIYLQFKG
jgi:hypothetical protein